MQIIANNKKSYYQYHILEKFEVGIVLTGEEVKSLRVGKTSINEAFAETSGGELWLINSDISTYKNALKLKNIDPKRTRKLLARKKDISRMRGKIEKEGMTIIPIKIYFNKKGLAKIEIAIAKGKKLYDKREDKKKKDWNIQKNRLLKNFR